MWWPISSPHVGNLPLMWPLLTIKREVNLIISLNICRSQGNVNRTIQEWEGQHRLFHAHKATFNSFIVGVRPVLFSQRGLPRNKKSSTHSKNFSKYFMYRVMPQGGGHFQNTGPKLRVVLHSQECSPHMALPIIKRKVNIIMNFLNIHLIMRCRRGRVHTPTP